MSNKKSVNQKKSNSKNIVKISETKKENKNSIIMKILVFFGTVIFCFILVYLMYYFFVEKSDIKINISTDKKLEYLMIAGAEELVSTQKYVSDLNYNMRYDINNFKVFKYKSQDIYKNLNDERILVVVEKSIMPANCVSTPAENEYNNCYIKVDDYTEEHYISKNESVYKITIKTPGKAEYSESTKTRVDYMLDSFVIV